MKRNQWATGLSWRNQWAIFCLAFIIVAFQALYWFTDSVQNTNPNSDSVAQYQAALDLASAKVSETSIVIFPFNPNYLTDYRAYTLGIPSDAVDRLRVFRSQGKFINSAAAFQTVTGISDSLLERLTPYFKFPSWVRTTTAKESKRNPTVKKDLNTAVVSDFEKVYGIGSVLAKRIVAYRDKLQGYSVPEQCYEVYGLDSLVVGRLLKRFEIQSKPRIEKKALNAISMDELLQIPYITVADARKIIGFRTQHGSVTIGDLYKIFNDNQKRVNRITLYLF